MAKQSNELAQELLKLIQANAKPVIRRAGANKLELTVQGKKFAFEIASRSEKKRRDVS